MGHLRANAIAYLALFVALSGGVAWAAATVGSKDIKDNAVKAQHIKDGQVKSGELEDDGVTGSDVDEESLDGASIDGVTPGGEVHSSGQVKVIDDPEGFPGTQASPTLVDTGTFSLRGICVDHVGSDVQATVLLSSNENFDVQATSGLDLTGVVGDQFVGNLTSSTNAREHVTFSAVSDNGEVLQGTVWNATLTQGAECVFAASGIGQ